MSLGEFDVVELLEDLPEQGLHAGQVGTIVDLHEAPPECEVEFTDSEGVIIALVALGAEQLSLRIKHVWVSGSNSPEPNG